MNYDGVSPVIVHLFLDLAPVETLVRSSWHLTVMMLKPAAGAKPWDILAEWPKAVGLFDLVKPMCEALL